MALADEMPLTAAYVAERRKAWGDPHVTAMVRAGMAGDRNCFWAVERTAEPSGQTPGTYRTVGAPFDWCEHDKQLPELCEFWNRRFMGMMKEPPGLKKGKP